MNKEKEIFEVYDKLLVWGRINPPGNEDNENLISSVEGYLLGEEEHDDFVNYISLYLNKFYQIDVNFNSWRDQIDHYAHLHGLDWLGGFFCLLHEILQHRWDINDIKKRKEGREYFSKGIKINATGENFLQKIKLTNEEYINVGDYIHLRDKIGEDYKKIKFYDPSLRNPSWDLFYPSTDDFQHIKLYLEEENNAEIHIFGKARRLFSKSNIKVERISLEEEQIIAYSDIFRIEIEEAVKEEEIQIITNNTIQLELTDFSDLLEQMNYYNMGIYDYSLMEVINRWCFYKLGYLNKDWHKFDRSINGRWYKK